MYHQRIFNETFYNLLVCGDASRGRGNGVPSHWGVTHDPSELWREAQITVEGYILLS